MKMTIRQLTTALEQWAPIGLQESYDNCGLQLGDPNAEITSALVCLDCTEEVVMEAKKHGCQLIISHHPLIFKGIKSLSGNGPVERTLLLAIKHDIALYALHTNLDNVIDGVNGEIAHRLGLSILRVLEPKVGQLQKISVLVPVEAVEKVRNAMFEAGAGHVGDYDECSFNTEGDGTFRPGPDADPYVGKKGERFTAREIRVEVICRTSSVGAVLNAMKTSHPYEEVAYYLVPLLNTYDRIGSGLVGEWIEPLTEQDLLARLKDVFKLKQVRHSRLLGKPVKKVALCGGSGAFLLGSAKRHGVDAFITGDVKYHDYFEVDDRLVMADIGHFGSEQYTMDLIKRKLGELFPTFAVRLTENVTDPIYHY